MGENLSRYRVLEKFAKDIVELQLDEAADLDRILSRIKRQAQKALDHRTPPRNEKLDEAREMAVAATKKKAAEFRTSIMPAIKDAQKDGCVSTRQIAEWLNKKGHTTARGYAWSSASVHRVITAED